MLPDYIKGRQGHTTTVVHCDSTHKRLTHFGGVDKEPEIPFPDTWDAMAETTIADLGEKIVQQKITF